GCGQRRRDSALLSTSDLENARRSRRQLCAHVVDEVGRRGELVALGFHRRTLRRTGGRPGRRCHGWESHPSWVKRRGPFGETFFRLQLPSGLALLAIVTTGVGAAMLKLALRAGRMDLREAKHCAACGKRLRPASRCS